MYPDNASGGEHPADDVLAIRGIGRATARRLHDAGLRTAADLARHSPSDIATKAHVRVSRVEREDWIGQARELAERYSPTGAETPETTSDDAEHRESFVLRLTLDDNKVIRTVVTHVRSEREAPPWAGWDTDRLLGFLSEFVDLGEDAEGRPPTGAAAAASALGGEPEPRRPGTATAGEPKPVLPTPLTPEVRMRQLEVVSAVSGSPQGSLGAGEPFAVRLAFDFQGAEPSSRAPFAYSVTIVATTMGESPRETRIVGEGDGTLGGTGEAALEVRSAGLPAGTYRVKGALRLREPDSDRLRLIALKGGLLQIIPG